MIKRKGGGEEGECELYAQTCPTCNRITELGQSRGLFSPCLEEHNVTRDHSYIPASMFEENRMINETRKQGNLSITIESCRALSYLLSATRWLCRYLTQMTLAP